MVKQINIIYIKPTRGNLGIVKSSSFIWKWDFKEGRNSNEHKHNRQLIESGVLNS